MVNPLTVCAGLAWLTGSNALTVPENTFIIKFTDDSTSRHTLPRSHESFHKRATSSALNYTVRHTYDSPGTYVGLSIQVHEHPDSLKDIRSQLRSLPGVASVSPVYDITIPKDPRRTNWTLPEGYSNVHTTQNANKVKVTAGPEGNLGSTLQMAGVEKLHALGIKGKGIKIGVIDTGVDHRHPALGAGFGPGHKIEGGYSWVDDGGNPHLSPDPFVTCLDGGHGTHVAGIIGMEPTDGIDGLNITGVAPEATIYMYRTFGCDGHGNSDNILAAMLRAQADGCDIVSMSLAIGAENPANDDPLTEVTAKLHDAGIAVIVAAGNEASESQYSRNLYTLTEPSELPGAVAVASIANKDFPLVYMATDITGASIPYGALWPIHADIPDGLDVYMVSDGCSRDSWNEAVADVDKRGAVNSTVFAFSIDANSCQAAGARVCCLDEIQPLYILGVYTEDITSPFGQEYDMPQ